MDASDTQLFALASGDWLQGWWTYELCHERHVKQFHVDLETARMEHVITLGTFNAESQPEQSEAQMLDTEFLLPGMLAKAYFSERYSGGSTCTLDNVSPNSQSMTPQLFATFVQPDTCTDGSAFCTGYLD